MHGWAVSAAADFDVPESWWPDAADRRRAGIVAEANFYMVVRSRSVREQRPPFFWNIPDVARTRHFLAERILIASVLINILGNP